MTNEKQKLLKQLEEIDRKEYEEQLAKRVELGKTVLEIAPSLVKLLPHKCSSANDEKPCTRPHCQRCIVLCAIQDGVWDDEYTVHLEIRREPITKPGRYVRTDEVDCL